MTGVNRRRRLVSISHSYAVALNRRLADEMSRVGGQSWDVLAVAPTTQAGDLRTISLERDAEGVAPVIGVDTFLTAMPHAMLYGHELRDVLRSSKWDIVHCWEEPYTFSAAQTAFWSAKDASIVFYTFQNLMKRYPPPFSIAERYCLSRSSGWIAAGEQVEQTMLARGYDSKPHATLPLGVDVSLFRPLPEMRATTLAKLGWTDDGTFTVGYLGRFIEEKGLRTLMDSLDRQRSRWRALFVGGGPMESLLREWATDRKDQVRILTGVSHRDVPVFVNVMDMLAAPSKTTSKWKEQFGRMIIEAFACGVPVIASNSGEIPFVVGDAGMIVPEGDVAQWTAAIALLSDNEPLRNDYSRNGIARVYERFSWSIVASKHLAFFNEIAP